MNLVQAYRNTNNLGDAFQTYALARLLPGNLQSINRGSFIENPNTFFINGYLTGTPANISNTVFAGVFVADSSILYADWMRRMHNTVGARDPYTERILKKQNVSVELIGCATLTLPRYDGPRYGELEIDSNNKGCMTQSCGDISWAHQWVLTIGMLDLIKRAGIVYTNRLHVALSALAFGTPVVVSKEAATKASYSQRFELLDYLGFRYDTDMVLDVSEISNKYKKFLNQFIPVQELNAEVHPTYPQQIFV